MSVLVDTSIWIRFVSNREPFASELERLLASEAVVGHELVYGELLIGDRSGRKRLLDEYVQIHRASSLAHEEVVEFVRARRLSGRGIGWIDAHLIAATLVDGLLFWTADQSAREVASEVGVAYDGQVH